MQQRLGRSFVSHCTNSSSRPRTAANAATRRSAKHVLSTQHCNTTTAANQEVHRFPPHLLPCPALDHGHAVQSSHCGDHVFLSTAGWGRGRLC